MNSFCRIVSLTILAAALSGHAHGQGSAAPVQAVVPAAPAKLLLPTDLTGLRGEMGKKVIVEGTLVLAGESKTKTVRYLNFTKNWRESVALVFFVGADGDSFSMKKLQSCVGRKVRATGVVSEYESNLQIQVDSWDQLRAIRSSASDDPSNK